MLVARYSIDLVEKQEVRREGIHFMSKLCVFVKV
jgi:hypothetical protein